MQSINRHREDGGHARAHAVEPWPEDDACTAAGDDDAGQLKDRLRRILMERAQTETLVTYKGLAERLGIGPPQTIRRVAGLLERLMAEDAEAGRPLLAALCVGRLRHNLPAPGFFTTAGELGLFTGDPEGREARDFHERELDRIFTRYRQLPSGRDLAAGTTGQAGASDEHGGDAVASGDARRRE